MLAALMTLAFAALPGCARQLDRAQVDRWAAGDLSPQLDTAHGTHGVDRYAFDAQADSPSLPELTLTPGVEAYVAAAIAHNPTLAAARARVRMLAERVPQVTSLADPMLEVAPTWRVGEGSPMELMLGISQELPFPGKLETRGRIAASQAAQAGAALAAARLEVINDTRKAYWMYYAAQRGIEAAEQTRSLLEQFRETAAAGLRAGRGSQADVLRASVELSGLDNDLSRLRQEKASAAAMLNQLMNRPLAAPLPDPAETDPVAVEIDPAALVTIAEARNPRLIELREAVHAAQLMKAQAKQEWLPDFRVGVSYGFMGLAGAEMDEDDEWGLGVGISLPLGTQRRRAMEREAAYSAHMRLAELAGERNRIAFRVHDAVARVLSQQAQVGLFRSRILPEAQQTVEASAASYRAGRAGFIELIDNWRALLNYRLMYHRNVAELHQALAELDAAVGTWASSDSGATSDPGAAMQSLPAAP